MVMAWRVRGGELPLSRTLVDPNLHYGQISTTQKPFLRRNAHSKTLYNAWSLLLEAQSSCVVLLVVLLRWNMGTKLGRSQPHVRPVGRFSRARTVETHLLSRLDAAETLHLPRLVGQVWFPGATHRAIKRCPKVWMQSWRTARNLIRFGTIRWVNSLGIKWERLRAQRAGAAFFRVSRMQVNTSLSLVVSKLASDAQYLMDSVNLVEMAQYERSLYTSARSLHKLVISELFRCL